MNPKRQGGLGRGLSAILTGGDIHKNEEVVKTVTHTNLLPIAQIETNPFQPRTEFDVEALEELAASIRVHGIIQPITVRKLAENQYQLIAGERRLRASKMADLTEIPAYIRTANDEQMMEMALIENIQRQDLNPVEIAISYKRMMEELGLKQDELGEKVGKNRATVANFVRLLKLPPEIQIGLRDAVISIGHAKPLITIENPMEQLTIYKTIVENGLNVRQTEELVRNLFTNKDKKANKKPEPKVENTQYSILLKDLQDKLENKFGNKVVLSSQDNGKGEIRIAFQSTDDLNRMIELLEI